jgi:hypothetical protein
VEYHHSGISIEKPGLIISYAARVEVVDHTPAREALRPLDGDLKVTMESVA